MSMCVQQGEPISPFLFVIQIVRLCETIKEHRACCGIQISEGKVLSCSPFSRTSPSSLPIRLKLPVTSIRQQSHTAMNPRPSCIQAKYSAIPAAPDPVEKLPNDKPVLPEGQKVTILRIPMGWNTSREQIVQTILSRTMDRCGAWDIMVRTNQGRARVAAPTILATLWYVLSALSIQQKEITRIQRVITHYMSKHRDVQWGDVQRRYPMNSGLF